MTVSMRRQEDGKGASQVGQVTKQRCLSSMFHMFYHKPYTQFKSNQIIKLNII